MQISDWINVILCIFSFILISNANHIAGISNFYDNVYLDDGKFEVLFCNLTRRNDIIKSLLYLKTSDITKVPGFYFYKTDKLEIDFQEEIDKWCVDGEELEQKNKTYKIDIAKKINILLPKKNINKLFINDKNDLEEDQTKKTILIDKVKSIIKK